MKLLAGDVGGTKTLLQIIESEVPGVIHRVVAEQRFESRAYPGLEAMVGEFLQQPEGHGVEAACFGLAGPVVDEGPRQHALLTNLPWQLDSLNLAIDLSLRKVRLINDFQAIGYSLPALGAEDCEVIQRVPAQPWGARVVLGAGTGLGTTLVLPCGASGYTVFPTEAGHTDFAPTDEEQAGLLRYLTTLYGRVSYERVLSGSGIESIYRYLRSKTGGSASKDPLLSATDPAAAISAAALAGEEVATQAVDLFVKVYGSYAGNLALTCLASGGVYLAGGIAPKILAKLRSNGFTRSFNAKGRMTALALAMPIFVITNPKSGLMGAALAASHL